MDANLQFRAEQLASEFAQDLQTPEDFSGLMRLMTKTVLEKMLDAELNVHLGRRGEAAKALSESPEAAVKKRSPNRRNGRSKKTVEGETGELTIVAPRDRDGTFEPIIVPGAVAAFSDDAVLAGMLLEQGE